MNQQSAQRAAMKRGQGQQIQRKAVGYRLRWQAKLAQYPAPIRCAGFTLIELSIVIMIVSLLAAGLLVGQSMIRAAEMRSVISEINQYQTVLHVFRLKYGQKSIPGDFNRASQFWPGVSNGDGNRIIDTSEAFYFWQHLAAAELIPGSYTGIAGPGGQFDAVLGSNVPTTKLKGVGMSAISIVYDDGGFGAPALLGDIPGTNYAFALNQIVMGHDRGIFWTGSAFLTPLELYGIDSKIDNGRPGTGGIIAGYENTGCSDAANAIEAATDVPDYRVDNEVTSCYIIIMPKITGLD